MNTAAAETMPVAFTPDVRAADPLGNYWLRQATYRLRREICWLWHERGSLAGEKRGTLPPFADKLSAALDLTRHSREKELFFAGDEAARYLTDLIKSPAPTEPSPVQGSFAWVTDRLS